MSVSRYAMVVCMVRALYDGLSADTAKPGCKARFLVPTFRHIMSELEEMYFDMAKGKSNVPFDQFKFASITLTKNDAAAFKAWYKDAENDAFMYITQLIVEGWKFSASWSTDNDCYIASLTCRATKHRNENVVVTSRSNDLIEAMMLGVYKINVMFAEKALPTERAEESWG